MKRTLTVATALVLFLAAHAAHAGTFVPKDIDEAEGPIVYQLGNSHTDSIREELAGLAGAAGHTGYMYGTHTIPGAPLRWLAGHPRDSFERLKQHSWDFVTLQSYNSTNEDEIQAAIAYSKAAYEGNEDVHIIMYSIWPSGENWDNPGLGRREEWNEGVMQRIREELPNIKVHVAPTSLVIRRVGNAADAGRIPGMVSRRDLFADPGHMGPLGAYTINLTMCAMIFQEDIVGYPGKVLQAGGGRPREDEVYVEIDEETARAIQLIVRDTLAEYEHDGVDTGMVINSGYMAPGVIGHRYDQPLPVVNAPQDPVWTIAEGELPAGLKLEDGRIQGTPTEAAEANLKLHAKAGDETAERTVKLVVDPDLPLTIPDQGLETDVARNEYFYHNFKASGGVGRVTWSVGEGKLPKGLKLVDGGLLMGTPGEMGTFEVTIQAVDQHPAGPRTATRTITFKSSPSTHDSIHARRVTEKWEQDGKLDESFWKLENVLEDADGNEVARFDVVWFEDPENRNPAKTRDLLVAVKITGESTEELPLESIHMYLDNRHNREIIYNEDDLHWVAYAGTDRDGNPKIGDDVVQGYKSSNAFDEAGQVQDGRPVVVEVEVSRKVFAGHGVHTTFGPNNTYGFDLAVGSREDAEKRAYLFSGPKADKDTSVFGTLVIEPAD